MLAAAAAGTKAIGQIVQGQQAYEAGKYNRAVDNANALSSERDASAQVEQANIQARKAIGDQVVAQAGSGFQMGTGTQADALTESQVNAMMDAMTIRRQGETRAAAYQSQGQLAYMQGKSAQSAGFFGAASSIVDAVAKYDAAGS